MARSTEVTGGPKYHNGEPLYSVHNFFQQADIRHAIAVYRTNVKLEKACPGLGTSCVSRERTKILGKELANLALDFTPIVGDGKAFWDAYKSGSAIDWGAAIVGIAPLAGDGLGKLLKGGKRKNVGRADLDEFKTEQKRLPAPEKRRALPKPDYKVPKNFNVTKNADGSVVVKGPKGAKYDSTAHYDSQGRQIYKSEKGGYYTLDGGVKRTGAPGSHGNSKNSVGNKEVYTIKAPEGSYYKVGKGGLGNTKGGKSVRAEQQVRKLNEKLLESDPSATSRYSSEVRKEFSTTGDATSYEGKLRDRYRSRYGETLLPGNNEPKKSK